MKKENLTLAAATCSRWLFFATALLAAAPGSQAQGILGTNLIVNGDAETGPPGTATTKVASIPSWTRVGNANVLSYGMTGYVLLSNPAPPDHGFQYFYSGDTGAGASTLTQTIDVSSGASIISAGNIKFIASAYLGGDSGKTVQVTVAFQNANGQPFSTTTLGPAGVNGVGLSQQQHIGLVPAGTVHITVTISFSGAGLEADSLSLVLSTLGTSPASILGTNLVVNPGAEAGPSVPAPSVTRYVPGWSTDQGLSVCPYGGTGWVSSTDQGPADRGVNHFCKGLSGNTTMYQDIDISAAASLIDAGSVTYQISAWLGGINGTSSPTVVYTFFDWSGNQIATTGQMGPLSHTGAGLVETSHSGLLPSGARRVNILLNFLGGTLDTVADNINFTLAAPNGPPVIKPAGIVSASAYGAFSAIAPGTWIEIYGANLAPDTRGWAGSDFNNGVGPTSLDGVTVSIGGVLAYLDYISPGQINALVPSNAPLGVQEVTVTNATTGTSDNFGVQINATEPGLLALQVGTKQYVGALFSDGQTFAIPPNAIAGLPSRAAQPGEVLTIYGVGFGPVTPGFSAGTIVTQQNSLAAPLQVLFNTTAVTPIYYGLAPSYTGLYQFNVVVPNVPANSALPITFSLGGVKGTQTLYIAVQ